MLELIFTILLLTKTPTESPQNPVLEVSVQHANSDQGMIRILVFSSEKGFPDQPELAIRSISLSPKNKRGKVVIEDLPLGKYAISAIHDEDENGKLNTNLVGYPLEKFGFSNNPKIYVTPPSFEKASFEVQSGSKHLSINLR